MEGINNLIYLNNNATTRMDDRVAQSMILSEKMDPGAVMREGRLRISQLIGCKPHELFFSGGITPALHEAIAAIYTTYCHKGKHIVTSCIEHAEVFKALDHLKQQGAEVTYLPVNREGLIDAEDLRSAIRADTAFVTLMAANNHTGVIQPIEAISELCRQRRVLFFSDASQFVGKMRCDATELGMDSMVFGSHKMHGPKGIGVIFVREGTELHTTMQRHPAFEELTALAGLAKAAELCEAEHWENSAHISRIKNYFEHQLLDIDGLQINGSTRYRLYNTSNLTFPAGKNILSLPERFRFLSYADGDNHVLAAMGLTNEEIQRSFRFSFGKYNTLEEVQLLVEKIMEL